MRRTSAASSSLPLALVLILGCQNGSTPHADAATPRADAPPGDVTAEAAAPQPPADGANPLDAGPTTDAAPQSDAMVDGAAPVDAARDLGVEHAVPSLPGWTYVWSDEFDEPAIDESRWHIIDAPGTKANAELERYTTRKNDEPGANSYIKDGALVIEAREEATDGFAYTSARLESQANTQFQYGRFEARAKLPAVTGLWPAFWMLGANRATAGWPVCGEIDIMEGKGRLPNWTAGSLHRSSTPGAAADIVSTKAYTLPTGDFHASWHVFAVEWDAQQIRWYVDDALYETVARPSSAAQPWPFDQPFYILLNLAVGGLFDANAKPPAGTPPQQLVVDYVRVYKKSN